MAAHDLEVKVPPHNKDCEGCLERALQISKILEVVGMLSDTCTSLQELISDFLESHGSAEERAEEIEELRSLLVKLDERVKPLEDIVAQATGAKKAMTWATKILWMIGGSIVTLIGLKGTPVFKILHSFTGYMAQ